MGHAYFSALTKQLLIYISRYFFRMNSIIEELRLDLAKGNNDTLHLFILITLRESVQIFMAFQPSLMVNFNVFNIVMDSAV